MKYEVEAKIKWTVKSKNTKDYVQQQAFDDLVKIASDLYYNNLELQVTVHEEKCNDLQRIKEFSWKEIQKQINKTKNNFSFKHQGKTIHVKMNSQRYFLFRENNKCVCCGIEGTKIICEKNPNDVTPHFNLYAVQDKKYILLTKDHIRPKCVGGKDKHSNYQTMCSICNGLKGHSHISLKNLQRVRKIYDKNKNGDRKLLNDLIDNTKLKFENKPITFEHQSPEYIRLLSKDAVKTRCDLSIYFDGSKYFGMSIYDVPKRNLKYIGNIRRNIYLEPLFSYKNHVECQIHKSMVISINKSLLKNC